MAHRRIPLLFSIVLLCMSPLAMATAPTDAQIDKLLTVMRARDTVGAMLPQVEASQKQMVARMSAGRSFTPAQRASLERITEKSSARIRQALAWDKLERIYRDIYRQTFSGEDIDAMIGFYGSPAGQHVLEKMPELLQHTMAAMQDLVVPMLRDMQQDIESEAQDMRAQPQGEDARDDRPTPSAGA